MNYSQCTLTRRPLHTLVFNILIQIRFINFAVKTQQQIQKMRVPSVVELSRVAILRRKTNWKEKGSALVPRHFFLFLFAPFIFLGDLFLLRWCEIILNVECLTDFLWSFAFDHVSDRLTGDIQ